MGKRTDKNRHPRSHTLPSSPTHSFSSSSSSDFEFTISLSPRKATGTTTFYPADELFYKGQLLPLHLSPRISMVRTLLLASSSISSSSETNTTASRDSTGSSNDGSNSSLASDYVLLADCDSSRPSSVTEEDVFSSRITNTANIISIAAGSTGRSKNNYLSKLSRFSSVFRKDSSKIPSGSSTTTTTAWSASAPLSVKRMSATAKEVLRKYLKKVKPLYEKLSTTQKQQQQQQQRTMSKTTGGNSTFCSRKGAVDQHESMKDVILDRRGKVMESSSSNNNNNKRLSFSGNLRYPRKKNYVTSCPSSMRSSPSHSGILCRSGFITPPPQSSSSHHYGDSSSMEELQSAIQGAIAHCKNSMTQNA